MTDPMNKNLLCKDCVHSFIKWDEYPNYWILKSPYWHRCRKSFKQEEIDFNPVTGGKKLKPTYNQCSFERGREGLCGPSAKNWSPKHKKDLFKLLTR